MIFTFAFIFRFLKIAWISSEPIFTYSKSIEVESLTKIWVNSSRGNTQVWSSIKGEWFSLPCPAAPPVFGW